MASQFPGDRPQPVTPPPPPYSPGPGGRAGFVERIKNIIVSPKTEWPRIDVEPGTAQSVFMSWAVPLAAIGPVCSLIGGQVFGMGAFGIRYHPPIVSSVVSAVLSYAAALAGVWILALIVDALAPTFGSQKDMSRSMKLAAYSLTPGWIAGVLSIIPMLGTLALLAMLYGFYLFWVGLPILKKTPADKAVGYIVVTIIADIVVYFVLAAVIGAITASMMFATGGFNSPGAVTISGTAADGTTGSVDLGKLQAATAQLTAAAATTGAVAGTAANGATTTTAKLTDPAALQAMLPASVGGFTRTAVESSGGSAGGLGASTAKGTYTQGDQSFELSVSDVGALGGLANLGGALNINANKQTATGYEKTSTQNGSMVEEDWDNSDHRGKYTTMVASRFAVEAEGNAPSIDPLKNAVAMIDAGRLAAMAK